MLSFPLMDTLSTLKMAIEGMSCAACSASIERMVGRLAGVESCAVNLAAATGTVVFDPALTNADAILTCVSRLGFTGTVIPPDAPLLDEERRARQRRAWRIDVATFVVAAMLAACTMVACMTGHHLLALVCCIPVQFGCGARFYRGAWAALRRRAGNMDVLVAFGTTVAFVYSVYLLCVHPDQMPYFDTCTMLISFVLLGKILEGRAKASAADAIEALVALSPATARVLRAGQEEEVACEALLPGDVVVVRAGQKVPADSVVVEGAVRLDESMLTGESRLQDKGPGSELVGATLVMEGEVHARVTRIGADSTLAHIVHAVEDAQGSKAPVQRLADRIAALFVPTVLGLAVVTFLCWWLLPLALGMASGLGGARFEHALMAGIAVVVVACPCALGLATPTALMVGCGIGARCGVLVRDGEALERACRIDTVVFDKTGTLTRGIMAAPGQPDLADELKDDAAATVAGLKARGIEVRICSGDVPEVALRFAREAGIDEACVTAGVLPGGKGAAIEALKAADPARTICMVGDGINDAPALAAADVSMSMGAGTDVALQTAQIALMNSDVSSVLTAIELSCATMRKIRQNLFWALAYNAVMIPLAAFGVLGPAVAGACMALSSVSVVTNSLLLKRFRPSAR